jgi:hypothetical protein
MARRDRAALKSTVPLRRLTPVPKAPPGWNLTEVAAFSRTFPGAFRYEPQEPAGDPPVDWPGTRPEWAIYWAAKRLGFEENVTFFYLMRTWSVGKDYFSQLDFFFPEYRIGIEIQGTFWHYGQGTEKIAHDEMRRALYAQLDITVIFIDEDDALADPIYYLKEALAGRDHSRLGRGLV